MLFPILFSLFLILIKLILASSNDETTLESLKDQPDNFRSSDNVLSESSLTIKEIYDPITVSLISKAFHKHRLFVPKAINQKIADYSSTHDKTINEFLDRIVNKIKEVTGQQQIFLNPYSSDFVSNLSKAITNVKQNISIYDQFWYDLARFLFKYTLLMRKKFAADNDNNNNKLFEKSVENIKDIMIIVNEKIVLLDADKLQSMNSFDFFIFDDLIRYEIFDHFQLLEIFINHIIDNRAILKMTLDEIEKDYCNGSFDNNNPLLKMMLVNFAFGDSADEQMLKRGWITSENMRYRGCHNFAIALSYIYSIEEEERGDKVYAIESLYPFYLSHSTIKFFIDKKLRFQIDNSSSLVLFLRKIDYIGLPKGSLLKEIIKTKVDEEDEKVYKCDKDIFSEYLVKERKGNYIYQEEYDKFIKLIN